MKKIISMLLTVMMIMSMISGNGILALEREAEETKKEIINEIKASEHNHGILLGEATELNTGSYYLNTNKTITEPLVIKSGAKVDLCLNGNSIFGKIKNGPIIKVESNATLTIYNCTTRNAHITSKDENHITECCIYGDTNSKISINSNISMHYSLIGIIFEGKELRLSDKVKIFDNNSYSNGGGIYLKSGSLIMDSTVNIYNNTALKGGGIYVENADSIEGGNIYQNTALKSGGGVYVNGVAENLNTDITNNKAVISGGGLFVAKNATANSKSYIKSNTAVNGGGAFVGENGTYKELGYITENTAENGGGVCGEVSSNITMNKDSEISYNSSEYGGGIFAYNFNTINLQGTIKNNTATSGGGMFLECYRYNNNYFSFCTSGGNFENNTATDNGGAVFLKGNIEYKLLGGEYKGNSAEYGGAIYTEKTNNSTSIISESDSILFENNKAFDGGAFYIQNQELLRLSNSDFKNNKAENNGGAIFSEGFVELKNINAESNTAKKGSFIYCKDGEVNFSEKNTFISNTTIEKSGVVDIEDAKVYLKDNMGFKDNTSKNCFNSGIFIKADKYFYISGKMQYQSKIPLEYERAFPKGKSVKVAVDFSKHMPGESPSNYFSYIIKGYNTYLKDGDIYIQNPTVTIENIEISLEKLNLTVNQTYQLSYIAYPENAAAYNVIWSSDNKNVATVDENGKVTALSVGEATITLKTLSGLSSECKVIVEEDIFHHNEQWTVLKDNNISKSGYYYLNSDNPFIDTINISAENVLLCLNGHNISNILQKTNIIINKGSNVTICDCTEAGQIIDGENGIINYGNLTLKDITIKNSLKSGIINAGGSLKLNNVDIYQCTEHGIYTKFNESTKQILEISDSVISNNEKSGIYLSEKVKLIFSGNILENSVGIYAEDGVEIEFFSRCLIQNNINGNVYLENKANLIFNENYIKNSSKIGFTVENFSNDNNSLCTLSDRSIIKSLFSDIENYYLLCNKSGVVYFSRFELGDVNADGIISMLDVTLLQRLIASIESYDDYSSYDIQALADVNFDGFITMLDVTTLQQLIAGIL